MAHRVRRPGRPARRARDKTSGAKTPPTLEFRRRRLMTSTLPRAGQTKGCGARPVLRRGAGLSAGVLGRCSLVGSRSVVWRSATGGIPPRSACAFAAVPRASDIDSAAANLEPRGRIGLGSAPRGTRPGSRSPPRRAQRPDFQLRSGVRRHGFEEPSVRPRWPPLPRRCGGKYAVDPMSRDEQSIRGEGAVLGSALEPIEERSWCLVTRRRVSSRRMTEGRAA
jgi:hypothetical protein